MHSRTCVRFPVDFFLCVCVLGVKEKQLKDNRVEAKLGHEKSNTRETQCSYAPTRLSKTDHSGIIIMSFFTSTAEGTLIVAFSLPIPQVTLQRMVK